MENLVAFVLFVAVILILLIATRSGSDQQKEETLFGYTAEEFVSRHPKTKSKSDEKDDNFNSIDDDGSGSAGPEQLG